jgi:hypothetical protein
MKDYTIILDEGIVIRNSDGVTIAPCQSTIENSFVEYINWINQGNEPDILETRL